MIGRRERTQVAIVGAGPAGLLLSHLLSLSGIESIVLEHRSREYVEARVRAGVLESGSADLLRQSGLGERLDHEGLVHRGINLQFEGVRHRIDFEELTGKTVTVYGQQEVVKDLIRARLHAGGRIEFEAQVQSVEADPGLVTYEQGGETRQLRADAVAACDGSHGVGRLALGEVTTYEREYPHAWLGILAQTQPPSEELIYAYHRNGFALASMRTPEISRLYLQVAPDETLRGWPEDRIWAELRIRLGEPSLKSGEILEIGITPTRSRVVEPMQRARLFAAGDAAHIVPPTGAKGMNLALTDVALLSRAMGAWFKSGNHDLLDSYSADCAVRVWRSQQFSSFMTNLLHRDPAGEPFDHRLRLSNLAYVCSSRAAAASLAENYTSAASGGLAL